MQYASDNLSPEMSPRMMRPRVRRAVLDELDKPEGAAGDIALPAPVIGPRGPRSGNTGIAGAGVRAVAPPLAAPAAPAPTAGASSSYLAQRYAPITKAYQQYLGRTPSDDEILSQTGNGTFTQNDPRIRSSVGNIQWSPEAEQLGAGGDDAAPTSGGTTTSTSPFAFNNLSVSDILKRYPSTPAGLQQAFAENPELAGVSQIGGSKGDKILDPNTGRMIDVILAAGEGGKGWQWLDDVPGQAQAAPDASGGAPGNAMRGMDPAMSSIIDQVRQSIMALMGNK